MELTRDELDHLVVDLNDMDFDTPFVITGGHAVAVHPAPIVPSVEHDEVCDVQVYDAPGNRWSALTGFTGQYSYSGAVMHPSEHFGAGMAEAMAGQDAGTMFAVCVVEDPDEDEPVGWAVLTHPPFLSLVKTTK